MSSQQNTNLGFGTWIFVPRPLEPVLGRKFDVDFDSAMTNTKCLQPEVNLYDLFYKKSKHSLIFPYSPLLLPTCLLCFGTYLELVSNWVGFGLGTLGGLLGDFWGTVGEPFINVLELVRQFFETCLQLIKHARNYYCRMR